MVNQKIIQRAMAKSMVHDTTDLLKLVNKYQPVGYDISMADLLFTVQDLLAANVEFAQEYTDFLVKKGRLVDYNNNSAIGIVAGITGLLGSVINSGASKAGSQTEYAKVQASNTQQLMQFMMLEEQAAMQQQKQKSNLIYLAVGSMVLITGLLIFMKKSKK